jgi:hypothetical protein
VAEVVFSSRGRYFGYLEDGTGFFVERGREVFFDVATPAPSESSGLSELASV